MVLTRILAVLALALGVLVGTATAGPAKGLKRAKVKQHVVHGVVVKLDKDKVNGTITVRVRHKKQGDATPTEEEKTFHVTDLTKYEKVIIKGKGKDEREHKPAAFSDLQLGQHVSIVTLKNSNDAREVAILHRQKKAKAE